MQGWTFYYIPKEEIPLGKNFKDLSDTIERKREFLHDKINFYQDLSHPAVIRVSQELDELLNQIYRMPKQQLNLRFSKPKQGANGQKD